MAEMSKTKKILACIASLTLVLCVGYFSVMSPTSAWFYDSGVIDSGDSFVFGSLSVNSRFVSDKSVSFEAATDFTDENEIFFDDMVHTDTVNVSNAGNIPARVYIDVKNVGESKGLRWFAYTDSVLVDSSVKKTLKNVLDSLDDNGLSSYNIGADSNSGWYVLLQPGQSEQIKIATWIQYDDVKNELQKNNSLSGYDVEITMTATQDIDGAMQR
ncbi:MAG: hypothetical protein PUB20_00195 [Clostridia bacterium]|nr:hypothetical protein [Clostridia bacterium]